MWKQENQDRPLKQQLYHFWEESKNKRMHTLYEASFLFSSTVQDSLPIVTWVFLPQLM